MAVMLVAALACQEQEPAATPRPTATTASLPIPAPTPAHTPTRANTPAPITTPIATPMPPSGESASELLDQAIENLRSTRRVAFEIDATLDVQTDGGVYEVPIKYSGESLLGSFDRMDVEVEVENETLKWQVLTIGDPFHGTLLFEPSTGSWEPSGRESPLSVDFQGLLALIKGWSLC